MTIFISPLSSHTVTFYMDDDSYFENIMTLHSIFFIFIA